MAKVNTVEGLRSQMVTSIYGRRMGIDGDGAIVGPTGYRLPVSGFDAAGATTGYNTTAESTLSAYGVSVIGSTSVGSAAYTIQAPIPGVRKYLVNPTTATVTINAVAAGAYFTQSTAGGAVNGSTLSISRGGISVGLIGITTAAWAIIGGSQSTVGAFLVG